MNTQHDPWMRLARTVRASQQQHTTPDGAPFGFATRVVARWKDAAAEPVSPWELLSLKSLAFAVVVMLASVGVSYQSVAEQFAGDAPEPAVLISLLSEE